MRNRLFTILSALSLLPVVAACVLWVRSYRVTDMWAWLRLDLDAGRATEFRARSERGRLHFIGLSSTVAPGFYADPADLKRLKDMQGLSHSSRRADYGGAGYGGADYGRQQLSRLPHWVLLPPLAVLPALWARRRRTDRHRSKGGLCLCCGYDVRASKERCPECGTPIQTAGRNAGNA